jgi:hypothetical protein
MKLAAGLEQIEHLWHLMPNDHLLRRTRRVVLVVISVMFVVAMATDVFAVDHIVS